MEKKRFKQFLIEKAPFYNVVDYVDADDLKKKSKKEIKKDDDTENTLHNPSHKEKDESDKKKKVQVLNPYKLADYLKMVTASN
jgi:hypothetical protein